MTDSNIPGAPEWLQHFFQRQERRDEVLVERFRGIVRAEVAPALTQLDAAINQARGYGTTVGEGMSRIDQMENRLAHIQSLLDSLNGPRPPAKASHPATPATSSARPRLVAASGASDHPSTIPAPPGDEGGCDGST